MKEGQGQLELRQEVGGLRHYLAGEPTHAGEILEILLLEGVWLEGRYEWEYRQGGRPLFYFALGGEWEHKPDHEPMQTAMRIPEAAILRWPRRDAFGNKPLT